MLLLVIRAVDALALRVAHDAHLPALTVVLDATRFCAIAPASMLGQRLNMSAPIK